MREHEEGRDFMSGPSHQSLYGTNTLPRRRNSSELTHHSQQVVFGPFFHYLAAFEAVDADPPDIVIRSPVGATPKNFPWWVPFTV